MLNQAMPSQSSDPSQLKVVDELRTVNSMSEKEKKERIKAIRHRIDLKIYRKFSEPIYTNALDLEIMFEEYKANGIEERKIIYGTGKNAHEKIVKLPTITGLTMFLGFEDRKAFYDMEKNPDLSYIIKRIRNYIVNHYESHLMSNNTVGAIFALKNFDWVDKSEQTINQTIKEIKLTVPNNDTGAIVNDI